MLYQVTISTLDLSRFAMLTQLLNDNGFGITAPDTRQPLPGIISDNKEIKPEPAKRGRKPKEEITAPVNHGTAAHPSSVPAPFDEAAYTKSGVVEATRDLNKARGRDAVIALLGDFGQTGETPSARNIPQKDWAAYVEQAKKLSQAVAESSLV